MSALTPFVLGLPSAGGGPDAVRSAVGGKLAVVTGASSGIGREMARRLVGVGAVVVGIARTAEALDELSAGSAGRFHPLAGDLRDVSWAGEAGNQIVAQYGAPALLISNAGHSIHRMLGEYTSRFHDIQRTDGVNYLGAVALSLPILSAMMRRGSGHLVYVSTTSVDMPVPGWSAYTASKGAYESWLRAVAPELRVAGVKATSVHLPRVRSAMSAPTAGRYPQPELSISQAADVVCRAIVGQPRFVIPWWARATAVIDAGSPAVFQRFWELALRAGVKP